LPRVIAITAIFYFVPVVFLMKNKIPLLFVLGLVLINLLSNSCKKDNQSSIQSLLTNGTWQLASVYQIYFVGDTVKHEDTLNTLCDTTQLFTFKSDNTCTYTNFDCLKQPVSSGHWSLSSDQLYLSSDMICKDTTATGSSKPFITAQIFNLGQFSLILRAGDVQNYTQSTKRKVIRYGFIRQKATVQ
jgi:hypothetical protein